MRIFKWFVGGLVLVILISVIAQQTTVDSPTTPEESLGIGDPQLVMGPGTYIYTIVHNDITRRYTLHVPQGYDSTQVYPLVFVLHGGGGVGAEFVNKAGFIDKADTERFLVVAPEGVGKNWNDGRGTTARSSTADTVTAVDDVDFILTLLASISATYAVDSDRVYATGVSNGAQMAQRLACDTKNTFAAIGPASGPMIEGTIADMCASGDSIAVVAFQGTEDPFFPIYDVDGIPELPRMLAQQGITQNPLTIEEITEFWSTKNRCSATPEIVTLPDTARDGTIVSQYTFTGCAAGADVVYYFIDNAGHGWPGGEGYGAAFDRLNGGRTDNLNATDVVWEFFAMQSLN